MNDYIEINIKESMPAVAEAMNDLKSALNRFHLHKYKCVLVIHGYGSTGKGGMICQKARQWLKAQERQGRFKAIVFGEDFSLFNAKARELKNKFVELEALMKVCNHGVTVIEL